MMIDSDCIGNCKSNYHMITTTSAPLVLSVRYIHYKIYIYIFHFRGNKNVTLSLSWNVIPNAGTLPKVMGEGQHRVKFPDEYQTSKYQMLKREREVNEMKVITSLVSKGDNLKTELLKLNVKVMFIYMLGNLIKMSSYNMLRFP